MLAKHKTRLYSAPAGGSDAGTAASSEGPSASISLAYDGLINPGASVETQAVRAFNNSIKQQQLVMAVRDTVCIQGADAPQVGLLNILDTCCGVGGDLHKYIHLAADLQQTVRNMSLKLGTIVMSDISGRRIDSAKDRLAKVRSQADIRICRCDSFAPDYVERIDALTRVNTFGMVSCQMAIHYACFSPAVLDTFLASVARSLGDGGLFVGTTLNAKAIAELFRRIPARKYVQPPQGPTTVPAVASAALNQPVDVDVDVDMDDADHPETTVVAEAVEYHEIDRGLYKVRTRQPERIVAFPERDVFGVEYQMLFGASVNYDMSECLVDIAELRRRALQHDMEMVTDLTLPFSQFARSVGLFEKYRLMTPCEKEFVGLHTTFVFRKIPGLTPLRSIVVASAAAAAAVAAPSSS